MGNKEQLEYNKYHKLPLTTIAENQKKILFINLDLYRSINKRDYYEGNMFFIDHVIDSIDDYIDTCERIVLSTCAPHDFVISLSERYDSIVFEDLVAGVDDIKILQNINDCIWHYILELHKIKRTINLIDPEASNNFWNYLVEPSFVKAHRLIYKRIKKLEGLKTKRSKNNA